MMNSGIIAWPTRWRHAIAMLLLCWALSFLGPLSYLIFFILGFAVVRAIYRKAWFPLILLIAANPLAFFFAGGIADYAKGTPTLRGMGLPGSEYHNIDPKTRCMRRSGGCLISGHEWVSQGFHNLGVRTAVAVFGYPARSYDGPYPSKEQALREISNAPDLPLKEFRKGEIRLGGRLIRIDPSFVPDWGRMFGMFELMEEMEGFEEEPGFEIRAKAVLFESRCLILRLAQPQGGRETQDFIILLDTRNLRPFAYYQISGDSGFRFPRVQYLPNSSR